MSKLDELRARLDREIEAAKAIPEKAVAEGREMSGEESGVYVKSVSAAKGTVEEIKSAEADEKASAWIEEVSATKSSAEADEKASLGERFAKSREYKGLIESYPGGRIPEGATVNSAPFGVKALLTGTGGNSGGAFVTAEQTGIYEPFGRRPLTIRSLVNVRTTGSDAVEYVRQLTVSNAAAPVPEATATAGTSGVKPESGFTFERVSETVKTLAVWVPATKRAIADVGQLMGLINQELRDDLAEEEEFQILTGDGTGENFVGVSNTPGTQSQAFDTDLFTTTRKAKTKVRVGGRSIPSAYVMNPEDWEKVDLAQDGMDRFYGNGPFGVTTPTLWGVPVVESEACPVGTAYLADWRKAVLWDREQATISMTNSHADFFIRNLVAILGEERFAFGIIRPSAFVEIDLSPT